MMRHHWYFLGCVFTDIAIILILVFICLFVASCASGHPRGLERTNQQVWDCVLNPECHDENL